MAKDVSSPMELGELESSPDLQSSSPQIELDLEDSSQNQASSQLIDVDKIEEPEDALNIQPPQQQITSRREKHKHRHRNKKSSRHSDSHTDTHSRERHRRSDQHPASSAQSTNEREKSRVGGGASQGDVAATVSHDSDRQVQVIESVDTDRRAKSQAERDRLERLERERHRLERERSIREREYREKLKAEQEQAAREQQQQQLSSSAAVRRERGDRRREREELKAENERRKEKSKKGDRHRTPPPIRSHTSTTSLAERSHASYSLADRSHASSSSLADRSHPSASSLADRSHASSSDDLRNKLLDRQRGNDANRDRHREIDKSTEADRYRDADRHREQAEMHRHRESDRQRQTDRQRHIEQTGVSSDRERNNEGNNQWMQGRHKDKQRDKHSSTTTCIDRVEDTDSEVERLRQKALQRSSNSGGALAKSQEGHGSRNGAQVESGRLENWETREEAKQRGRRRDREADTRKQNEEDIQKNKERQAERSKWSDAEEDVTGNARALQSPNSSPDSSASQNSAGVGQNSEGAESSDSLSDSSTSDDEENGPSSAGKRHIDDDGGARRGKRLKKGERDDSASSTEKHHQDRVTVSSESHSAASEHSTERDPRRSKYDDDDYNDDIDRYDNDRRSRSTSSRHSSRGESSPQRDQDILSESPVPSSPELAEARLPAYYPALQGCRNVEEFNCLNRIEEGTYGVVYRAIDRKTEEVVALKRLKMEKEKEGFPITSLREINTLLKAQHPNIVTVREIVVGSNMDKIYIVMDYVEHDLKALMETMKEPFMIGEVKTLLKQLLRGVAHLHDNWIIHRDLKTSNLLLSHKGILKIGDFGLAREYGSPLRNYTPIVVTLWYRAPELLLGTKQYSTPIDMWSVGCIFAEFITRKPLFPGKTEIDELNRIFKELGTPNEKIWPGVGELPAMKKCTFTEYPYNQLRSRFGSSLSDKGFDLMNRFLTYSPLKRVTADEALRHEFFAEAPYPVDPSMFPTWPAKSEMSRTRSHGNSPKPPSGGKAYANLLAEDDEISGGGGFHLAASKVSAGFSLKF